MAAASSLTNSLGPTISSAPFPRQSAAGKAPKPRDPIAPFTLDPTEVDQVNAFMEFILHQAQLSEFSNAYDRRKIQEQIDAFIYLSAQGTLLNRDDLNQKHLQDLTTILPTLTRPTTRTRHYGEEASYFPAGGGPVEEYKKSNNPPELDTPQLNRGSSRVTKVQIGENANNNNQAIYAQIDERVDTTSNRFISKSTLPADIDKDADQLNTWARAAVNSFLAGAPRGSNPRFDDGFSAAQLAAVIGYCDYISVKYDLGPLQIIRMYSEDLRVDATHGNLLGDADWDKLKNNEALTLTKTQEDDLMKAIDGLRGANDINDFLKTGKLASSYKDGADWHAWNTAAKHQDDRMPKEGHVEYHQLKGQMDAIATKYKAPPIFTTSPSVNPHSFSASSSQPHRQGQGQAQGQQNDNDDEEEEELPSRRARLRGGNQRRHST